MKSGERLLQLLLDIAQSDYPVGAKELARKMQIPVSTMYRHLSTLRASGLVREMGNGLYAIGPRSVQLASNFHRNFDLVGACISEMWQLANHTGETVALVVPMGHQAVCAEAIMGPQALRYTFTFRTVMPLVQGASARALLPHLDKDLVQQVIAEVGLTKAQQEALWLEIAAIKQQGYVVKESEVEPGIWVIGVPIFSYEDELEGALTVLLPASRNNTLKRERVLQQTQQAVKRIEAMLRGRGELV